ncbi:MAG TPA: hypothetical protein VMV98_07925, partial [Acidobacteriaceae bacterium]|nr:hypothetical protein [Acidobacteriaceae bacterium]
MNGSSVIRMRRHGLPALRLFLFLGLLVVSTAPAFAADKPKEADRNTYDQDTVLKDAEKFFG